MSIILYGWGGGSHRVVEDITNIGRVILNRNSGSSIYTIDGTLPPEYRDDNLPKPEELIFVGVLNDAQKKAVKEAVGNEYPIGERPAPIYFTPMPDDCLSEGDWLRGDWPPGQHD